MFQRLCACLLALTVLGVIRGQDVQAHRPTNLGDQALSDLVRLSEFIIEGRVVKVEYRLSDRQSEEDEVLPHTFVTYQIRSLLKGEGAQREVTLRFIGGPDGRGRYLTVSNVPLFEVGDEDVLFVVGNGERECPLVNCNQGRFQIRNGLLYDAQGFPLSSDAKGAIRARGQLNKALTERLLPPMTPESLLRDRPQIQSQLLEKIPADFRKEVAESWERKVREQPSLQTVVVGRAGMDEQEETREETVGLTPLKLETFLEHVRNEVDRQRAAGVRPTHVRSVTMGEQFFIRVPKPTGLPADAIEPKVPEPVPQTDQEKREIELLRKQDGDPVIRGQ